MSLNIISISRMGCHCSLTCVRLAGVAQGDRQCSRDRPCSPGCAVHAPDAAIQPVRHAVHNTDERIAQRSSSDGVKQEPAEAGAASAPAWWLDAAPNFHVADQHQDALKFIYDRSATTRASGPIPRAHLYRVPRLRAAALVRFASWLAEAAASNGSDMLWTLPDGPLFVKLLVCGEASLPPQAVHLELSGFVPDLHAMGLTPEQMAEVRATEWAQALLAAFGADFWEAQPQEQAAVRVTEMLSTAAAFRLVHGRYPVAGDVQVRRQLSQGF